MRERGLAQEQAGRKTLDRAADDAFGILGVDLAFDRDRQFAKRSLGGEGMGDVAEGVLVLVQQAILRQVDAPVYHILPVVIARREAQHLDHAGGRRVVAIGGRVGNTNSHELAGANLPVTFLAQASAMIPKSGNRFSDKIMR